MRKILVMGNGFVGTNIYNYFKAKGEDVKMVSILDFDFMDKKQVDNYFSLGVLEYMDMVHPLTS